MPDQIPDDDDDDEDVGIRTFSFARKTRIVLFR